MPRPAKPRPLPPPAPSAPRGLRIEHNPATGGLVLLTEHGLEVQISADSDGMTQLAMLCRRHHANEAKPPRIGLDSTGMRLVLAEWERAGGEGDGKVPVPGTQTAVERGVSVRKFTATGKLDLTLEDLGL